MFLDDLSKKSPVLRLKIELNGIYMRFVAKAHSPTLLQIKQSPCYKSMQH